MSNQRTTTPSRRHLHEVAITAFASIAFVSFTSVFASTQAFAEGDVKRGAQLYRACAACHALEPGLHLTGPSLADVWMRPAGQAESFVRYSEALRNAGFPWDAVALDAWLTNPQEMLAGTSMAFEGIPQPDVRADLIAFLQAASAPGGAKQLIEAGVMPAAYLRGQAPGSLGDTPGDARVVAVRHCGDGFTIETADGARSVHWEKNIRLKIDSTTSGPPPGYGVILGAGMQGDRYSVVFASLADLTKLVSETCDDR